MICPSCQTENPSNAGFCDQCGARLETACPNCGESNRRAAKFCRNCGQTINQSQSVSPSAATAPGPETYVPKHLAEKILATRHTLEGERKQVTVLFADIRDSMKLIENRDPEEAQKIFDPVLKIMMDAVHRYEGTVNQVLGDGIMALFGAPLAHEDHAVRACYAALAMQQEMRRYRENLGQSEEIGLQIGVGLNSGEVVLRSIDNDLNIDYSALGHTTHLAARMQEVASGGAILLTASTLREVEGFVQTKVLSGVQVKGISRPVDAYELIGATSARTRLHASVARGLTPFVGRKAEIETFQKLIEKSAGGRGQIFAMVGEPGMGKSRLVYEFTHSHVPQDWLVLEAPSVSYGKATPYFPVIELLRRYFEISEGDEFEIIRAKVVERALKLDQQLKDTIPPVLSLLGALPNHKEGLPASQKSNGQWQDVVEAIRKFSGMEPQQRRRYTLEGLKRVMIRESQKQPLLVVFEDLHWIDSETQAFLDNLVESLPMARMLLLVNYRPGYSHSWADKTYYSQLRVDPLRLDGAEELLEHLLGNNRDLATLKELLIKRTDGNPFFAEQSVRSLVETGILTGEKGAYRPGLKVDTIRIPSSVQNVVADRIDRLSVEEKHLLQTAAVIGVIVPFSLLRSVTELPDEELYTYLAKLQSAEFICETNLFPEVEYSFRHAITTEVAYGALLRERRTFLHGRIVRVLEEMKGNTAHDHLDKLAHHAYQGELWNKAVIYLKEAGAKAVSRSSFRNAVLCFERALEALRQLPETRDTLRHTVDLRIEIRNALFILGDFEQGLRYLEEAQAAAIALNDHGRVGKLLNLMTAHWQIQGDSEQAITCANQALDHTKMPEHLDLHIVAHYFLGVAHHNVGQYDQAIGVLERALSLIGDRKYEMFGMPVIVSVVCKTWLVRCLAQMGKFSEAVPGGDEAIQTAVEGNHPYSIVYAYYGVGVLFLIKGDFDKAIPVLERGLKVCQDAEIPVHRPLIDSCLGSAYASVGRLDEALPLLDRAVEDTAWMRRIGGQALRMAWVSGAYMLAGRTDAAEAFARRGLELSGKSKDKGSRAWLLQILGDLTARRSPLKADQAEANYAEALGLARELGMRPLQAHCHLGLGHVHAQVKDISKARSELRAAVELYRAMSMPFWMSKAETALTEVT
jgi:class 3 adenylate cyclase/tetratricopeptide (TPR) repeat protein